jgi:hypothetical protein
VKWKILALITSSALIALLTICWAYLKFDGLNGAYTMRSLNAPAVITQVKKLNQLVTVKYRIQHVVGMTEPKVPLGEESILLMVQGQALAGVDLATLTQDDVAISGSRSVTLQLPAAKLLNVFLDEKATKVWDRRITWWTPWVAYDPDLEHKARLQALDEVRTAALEMGILDAAQRNAQNAIANFLLALHVDVSFKAPASPD